MEGIDSSPFLKIGENHPVESVGGRCASLPTAEQRAEHALAKSSGQILSISARTLSGPGAFLSLARVIALRHFHSKFGGKGKWHAGIEGSCGRWSEVMKDVKEFLSSFSDVDGLRLDMASSRLIRMATFPGAAVARSVAIECFRRRLF